MIWCCILCYVFAAFQLGIVTFGFVPDLHSVRTFPAVVLGSEPMTSRAKVRADRSKGSQEALLRGILLAELQTPLAHPLVGYNDPASGQQLFDIPVAEAEAKVQPDRVADHLLRVPSG